MVSNGSQDFSSPWASGFGSLAELNRQQDAIAAGALAELESEANHGNRFARQLVGAARAPTRDAAQRALALADAFGAEAARNVRAARALRLHAASIAAASKALVAGGFRAMAGLVAALALVLGALLTFITAVAQLQRRQPGTGFARRLHVAHICLTARVVPAPIAAAC